MTKTYRRIAATAAVAAVAGLIATASPAPAGAGQEAGGASRRTHLQSLYAGAHPESPARFRIIEDLDKLSLVGEIAQFRLIEDASR